MQPARLKSPEAQAEVQRHSVDLMVVAAYGLIVPQPILDFPRKGCINIHASLLPRWRGAAPIERALLAGDSETGISIMQMDAGLDTGPVLRQTRIPMAADDTSGSLHDKLASLGAQAIVEVLRDMQAGRDPIPVPQPEAGVSYANKIDPAEARIDWNAPAAAISRQVRAFNPHPGAWTVSGGAMLKLWRAVAAPVSGRPGTVLEASGDGILSACAEQGLCVCELQRAGGKRLSAAEFLRGHPLAPGDVLG